MQAICVREVGYLYINVYEVMNPSPIKPSAGDCVRVGRNVGMEVWDSELIK